MSRPACLEAALTYLERGWCAVPLCPPDHANCGELHLATCEHRGAEPVVHWRSYLERLPRPSELEIFWTRHPTSNVGVVLGRISGLIAIELEGPEADDLMALRLPPLPPTLTMRLPGGARRLFFAIPSALLVPSGRFDGPGCHVEVLGEATFTPLPPSVHVNGERYSWNCSSTPPLYLPGSTNGSNEPEA